MKRFDFLKTLFLIPVIPLVTSKIKSSEVRPIEISEIEISEADRQFIETSSLNYKQICKIYRIPEELVLTRRQISLTEFKEKYCMAENAFTPNELREVL